MTAVRVDATRSFIGVMVALVSAGLCWAGWVHAQARRQRLAADAAGPELERIARVGGELAGLAAGIRLSDQAAIREFLLFRAGLAEIDVKVDERQDGQRLVRTYAVSLGERTRKDAFRYAFNVRSQAPQLSLVEMSQEAIPGKSLRPHDRWQWRFVFATREAVEGR